VQARRLPLVKASRVDIPCRHTRNRRTQLERLVVQGLRHRQGLGPQSPIRTPDVRGLPIGCHVDQSEPTEVLALAHEDEKRRARTGRDANASHLHRPILRPSGEEGLVCEIGSVASSGTRRDGTAYGA
jgi:hypothetical protein